MAGKGKRVRKACRKRDRKEGESGSEGEAWDGGGAQLRANTEKS